MRFLVQISWGFFWNKKVTCVVTLIFFRVLRGTNLQMYLGSHQVLWKWPKCLTLLVKQSGKWVQIKRSHYSHNVGSGQLLWISVQSNTQNQKTGLRLLKPCMYAYESYDVDLIFLSITGFNQHWGFFLLNMVWVQSVCY